MLNAFKKEPKTVLRVLLILVLKACRSSDFFFKSVKENNQLEICHD